ncbi:MAG: rRNA pseudouridine synthase [Azonexus sp.]|jgi:23S rRNA pseudouridine2604 synthase|nr:rRNA pseudouridine synthase [Azonexus sp.]
MSGKGRGKTEPPPATAAEDPWAKWRSEDTGQKTEDSQLPAAKPPPIDSPPNRGEGLARPPRLDGTLSPLKKTASRKPVPVRSPSHQTRAAAPKPAAPVSVPPLAPAGVRLAKIMSERGLCSRREADVWIERGWVWVDGEPVTTLGARIDPAAEITISREAERDQQRQVTILLHKPVGYVSGQPEPDCQPAVTLISAANQMRQAGDPPFKPWMLRGLAPAGRLDIDSTGLLVLTRDGRIAKQLIGEDSAIEKEYLVRVSGDMIAGGLERLRHGLELDGKPLKPAWVKQLNADQLHFILKEGKKRQIRRMCEQVGLCVIGLKRVRIGKIRLGDLPLGHWRFLRADERF